MVSTYNRIFALTLIDLQRSRCSKEVEVRSRFFGRPEGGEHLETVVKDVEKGATDCASSIVSRRINVMMDELKKIVKD